jgi:hypothetical protein
MAADEASSTFSLAAGMKQAFNDNVIADAIELADRPAQGGQLRVTVFLQGTPVEKVRIELSSDADLFFFFESEYSEANYGELRDAQELTIDFAQFAPTLVEILNSSKKPEAGFTFAFREDPSPSLSIQQALKFKTVKVFNLAFTGGSDEAVKERIQTRYNEARAEVAAIRADLDGIYSMLKIKNPSILKQARTTRK